MVVLQQDPHKGAHIVLLLSQQPQRGREAGHPIMKEYVCCAMMCTCQMLRLDYQLFYRPD